MNADMPTTPPPGFYQACDAIGLSLSPNVLSRLGRYLHRLQEANQVMNLTAIRDPAEAWMRHGLESLSLMAHIGGSSVADVGSGGGAPAIPLAIAMPTRRFVLIESTGKKARFLQQVAGELPADNVTVINDRSEIVARMPDHRDRHDVVTARAVGSMRVLLEMALPLVCVGGRLLAVKGRKVEDELREAGDALDRLGAGRIDLYEALPGWDDEAVIVAVTKDRRTPRAYPRRPGVARQTPL